MARIAAEPEVTVRGLMTELAERGVAVSYGTVWNFIHREGMRFKKKRDQVLAPTLKPGDVVILDNLGSHKGKAVRRAIRASGARLLFLPPYSPDLNPIEQVFAKLKHLMRKAKERTVDATWKRTGSLLETFKSSECKNYLVNAGYASS